MKIKISELETYELKVPEELEIQEIASFIKRLSLIVKLASKDIVHDKPFIGKKQSRKALLESKENSIKFINIYSEPSKRDEANAYLHSIGLSGNYTDQSLYNLKQLVKRKWKL